MIDASWAKPSRTLRRKTAAVLSVPLGLVTFVVSLLVGAVLHLDLPATRLMARDLTVLLFNQAFHGTIAIEDLRRLGVNGLTASGVMIRDPEGRPVIQAAEVVANVALVEVLLRLVNAPRRIRIDLDDVTLRRPAVFLLGTTRRGPDGEPLGLPSIADAFLPRVPAKEDTGATTPLRLSFQKVRLERFYLRGRVAGEFAGEVNVPLAEANVVVTDQGVKVDVERFGLRASGFGGVDTLAMGEVRMQLPGAIHAAVRGKIGAIPLEQTFHMEGDHILIEGSLPSLEASALRPLFAGWPLEGTIGLRNRIEGTLPRLNADVVVTAGTGRVRATGLLTTAPELEADLDVDVENLDLSSLGPRLPQTRLNVRSALEIWLTNKRPNFEVNATLAESEYQGVPLPVVDLWGSYDERGLTADATLHERGLPVHLAVRGEPGGRLDFDLQMRRTSLTESPRLGALVQAGGEVSGTVKGHVEGKAVKAQWQLAGNGVSYQGVKLDQVTSTGEVSLDLDAVDQATIGVDIQGKGLKAGAIEVPELRLQGQGPVKRPSVTLDATTTLGAPIHVAANLHTDSPGLSDLSGNIGQREREVGVELRRASFADGIVLLRGLRVQSGGSIEGDVAIGNGTGEAKLTARDFDLRRLVSSFGLDRASLDGRLDLDIDAKLAHRSSGHARLKLVDASILGIAGLQVEVATELDGQRLFGQGAVAIEGVANAGASWNVTLDGPIAAPSSYPGVTGSAALDLTQLELSWLSSFLPESSGITRASGALEVRLEADRKDSKAFPDVRFRAKTTGLSVDVGENEELRRIDAIDLSVRGMVNQARQRLEGALGLTDPLGDLITASGSLDLPLESWIADPPSGAELEAVLAKAPLECVVLLPERRIVDFPSALRLPPRDGHLAARAVVRGSAQDPEFDLSASVIDLQGDTLGLVRPISVETSIRYRLTTGRLSGSLQARQGSSRVASAAVKVVLPLANLTGEVPDGTPAWTGAAQIVVEDAPLGLIAALTEQRLTGAVQGSVGITRQGYPLELDASLRLKQLVVGDTALGEGDLTLAVHDAVLRAKGRLEDEFGNLDASAVMAVRPTPWALTVDRQQQIEIGLRSNGHDAAVLAPFVGSTLSELSGELNGALELRLRPGPNADAPPDVRITGQLTMEDGVVTPSAMGLRLTDMNFSLRAERQGEFNAIHLTGLRAKARSTSDNLRGEGSVFLRGLTFDHASFRLNQTDLPLTREGAQIASVSGTLRGDVVSDEQGQEIKLDLSGLTVDLPSVADTDVIELSENPTVEVVQRPREEEVRETKADSQLLRIVIDLGPGVKVESSLFEVVVRGRPEIQIAGTTTIAGQLQLRKGGTVSVLGKVFLIEDGIIAFDTFDSTNPHLDISAAWRASSGVLVRAKISGTAKNPTLEWSSEPPLAGGEDEVLALVIGGGGGSTAGGGGQGQGVAMAGAAMAVNQLIGETGLRNVEVYAGREAEATEGEVARLSQRSWDSYTASIQLTEDLWFQGSYKQESGGGPADTRNGVSGTLDWRFAPSWSASTEIGTLGVGLDLLWQHRY
jgi:hypothetical protein